MWEKKAQKTGGKLSGEVQVSRDILRRRMDKNMIQRVVQHSRGATCISALSILDYASFQS